MNVFKNLLKFIFCKIGIHFREILTDKLRDGEICCKICGKYFEDGRY